MRASVLLRVCLAGLALAGVLGTVAGLLVTWDRTWPRPEVLGPFGLTIVASVGWWLLAVRAGPADGPPSRAGWWPARRRIVADTVLILGGICALALPSAAGATPPELVTLRQADPDVYEVEIAALGPVASHHVRGPDWYEARVTVRLTDSTGPLRSVTERVAFDRYPQDGQLVHVLYAPTDPTAGAVIAEDPDELFELLAGGLPGWFLGLLSGGVAMIVVLAYRSGPPGGWRAQARLRRALLHRSEPAIVLTGRLEAASVRTDEPGTLPAEFNGPEARGTIHFDRSFDLARLHEEFPGAVTLCWLPGVTRARWRRLHAAVLVSHTGRYAPVGIRNLPPVREVRPGPVLGPPVGPFRRAAGRVRALLVLAGILTVGILWAGVLTPTSRDPGVGFDNAAMLERLQVPNLQCCLLLVPLIGLFYCLAATGRRPIPRWPAGPCPTWRSPYRRCPARRPTHRRRLTRRSPVRRSLIRRRRSRRGRVRGPPIRRRPTRCRLPRGPAGRRPTLPDARGMGRTRDGLAATGQPVAVPCSTRAQRRQPKAAVEATARARLYVIHRDSKRSRTVARSVCRSGSPAASSWLLRGTLSPMVMPNITR
ncbi:hypothetical protein H4W31_006258 [Plantactinospora soyae]|uniref:DUF3592 domain-containing protein n=1 Tax=Plantactinospora soyae TaxID=1544732 RepID=A0A927QZN7_9ACTN|nr:hypothetical protein [Plantactinospora soyae]